MLLRPLCPLAATEGRKIPVPSDGVGQEKAGIVARRRVFRTWISQADDGAQRLLFLLALGLLLGLRGLALLFGGRSGCGLALGALLILAHLADELGLGHFGRGFGRRRGDFFGARRHHG